MVKESVKKYGEYLKALEKGFYTLMGQIDETTKEKMSIEPTWAGIKIDCDTIKMLLLLYKLYNQQHSTCMFKPLYCLRSNQKLYSHQRYKGESTVDYHKRLRIFLETFASMEHSFNDKALITVLEDNNKTVENFKDGTLRKAKKIKYTAKQEQLIAALLLIEGCGVQKENTIGKMLGERYLLGSDEYPCTPKNACDLINQFNKSKGGGNNQAQTKKGRDNSNQLGSQKTANNNTDGRNNQNQESTNFVSKGKETKQGKQESNNERTSEQLLIKALSKEDDTTGKVMINSVFLC